MTTDTQLSSPPTIGQLREIQARIEAWLRKRGADGWVEQGGIARLDLCENWRDAADRYGVTEGPALGGLLALVREAWDSTGATLDVVMLTIVDGGQRVRVMTIVAAMNGEKVWSTTSAGPACDADALLSALESAPR